MPHLYAEIDQLANDAERYIYITNLIKDLEVHRKGFAENILKVGIKHPSIIQKTRTTINYIGPAAAAIEEIKKEIKTLQAKAEKDGMVEKTTTTYISIKPTPSNKPTQPNKPAPSNKVTPTTTDFSNFFTNNPNSL